MERRRNGKLAEMRAYIPHHLAGLFAPTPGHFDTFTDVDTVADEPNHLSD
jgi:hypothetical protein